VAFEPSLGGEAILDGGHGEGWQGALRGKGLAGSLEEAGWGEECTLGRAPTRSRRALWMSGKESGDTAGWGVQGTQSGQSYQSHSTLDLEGAWWACYCPHSSMGIQAPARGVEAVSVSSSVEWRSWWSSASFQAWACRLEGPDMASCQSSCSSEVSTQRGLSEGTKGMPHMPSSAGSSCTWCQSSCPG